MTPSQSLPAKRQCKSYCCTDYKRWTITGVNPFTKQPDTISSGGATDLFLLNNGTSDIAFNDDNGATMTLAYR